MFNLDFVNVNIIKIVDELKVNGYFVFEQALTQQYVEKILQEIDFNQVLVNTNDVGVVIAQNQKFLTHCLASSKKVYDIITSEKVLNICEQYFGDNYKLTNHRVYQTCKVAHMPWHTDNNLQIGEQLVGKHNMPGLLFLFYLSDVTKNAFQYVKNSHEWSYQHSNEIYLADSFIEKEYGKDVLTFPMMQGGLIICSIHGVHRAEPFHDESYTRTTLLFQVDQVGNENLGHGEVNIINTEYMDNLNQKLMDYLGFAFKRSYPAFPNTSAATMNPQDILKLQKELVLQLLKSVLMSLAKALLPGSIIVNLKRILWHLKRSEDINNR